MTKMNDGAENIKIGMLVETIGGIHPGRKGRVIGALKQQCAIVDEETRCFNVYMRNVRVIAVKVDEPKVINNAKEKMKKIVGQMKEMQNEMKELEEAMSELLLGLYE